MSTVQFQLGPKENKEVKSKNGIKENGK
jgi:hypothetical protein